MSLNEEDLNQISKHELWFFGDFLHKMGYFWSNFTLVNHCLLLNIFLVLRGFDSDFGHSVSFGLIRFLAETPGIMTILNMDGSAKVTITL